MGRKKEPTTGITLRLPVPMLRRFHELAATATLRGGGSVAITAQDIMRDWLNNCTGEQLPANIGKREKIATTGITLRLPNVLLARFHKFAAAITISSESFGTVSAQDVMRAWLETYPGLKREASPSNNSEN